MPRRAVISSGMQHDTIRLRVVHTWLWLACLLLVDAAIVFLGPCATHQLFFWWPIVRTRYHISSHVHRNQIGRCEVPPTLPCYATFYLPWRVQYRVRYEYPGHIG
ncbi:hypothetical protein F4778DRAFT_750950 [Xylariomycetidae sp. FL2044]|nr:hypothetical protein F4778DRAFT_750950 [Xylariomycetidae sp. FL2044]